ncbi:hypothetical protein HY991_00865 [Candidatus Micrarchaeota archaeon]|nr:hypothetical protein [Candidatus Micrarchaeota archaeon]
MEKTEKNDLSSPLFQDFRGEIRRFEIHGTKFNVLFTKAGYFRSGDYHPVTQYDLMLKGEVEITMRQNDDDVVIKKGPNELIVLPPGIPHLFKALTDTVMIEWWDGPFRAEYYAPYRKFVEEQSKKGELE